VRLFYNNLIDAAGVVITPSSEVSTLPAENVAHEFRKRVWRTGTSTAAENVVFDLLTAQAVTAVILLDHTLTSGDSSIILEGNTADSWGAPAFTTTLTYAADIISKTFASQSYRYWRMKFTKTAAGVTRDIGRIFIGTYDETAEDPDYDGLDVTEDDNGRSQSTIGGQEYNERQDAFRIISCKFTHISQTMKDQIVAYVRTVRQSLPHFVQVATVSPFNTIYYVRLRNGPKFGVRAMDSSAVWDCSLEFKEQL
jgi:hypothetical protein